MVKLYGFCLSIAILTLWWCGQLTILLVHWSCSQTKDSGIWLGNETTRTHAYNIWKWRPSQWTAATECCEWLLLTTVNLKLWIRRLVVELRVMTRISFTLKWRWVFKLFARYHCWKLKAERRKKEYEKWHFHDRTLSGLAVFLVAFGHLCESCWSQRHSIRMSGCLNKL